MEPIRRTFRGYDPAQVDSLVAELRSRIDGLAGEIEQLRRENERLAVSEGESKAIAADLQQRERSIQEALVSAHASADEVVGAAREQAEQLLQVAREASARYQDDLRGRIADLNWQIERLTLQKRRFADSFRSLLEQHLGELAEPPSNMAPEADIGAGSPSIERSGGFKHPTPPVEEHEPSMAPEGAAGEPAEAS